jgi:hypothetical protein
MGTINEGARAELIGHVRRDQELKDEIDEKTKEREEVRQSIEMILRAHNSWEEPISELSLKVTLEKNRESRTMNYKVLMSEHEDLYNQLVDKNLLTISPPKKMYRLEVRSMKTK